MKKITFLILLVVLTLQACSKLCCPQFSQIPQDTFGKTTHPNGSAWAETDIMIDKENTSIEFIDDEVVFTGMIIHNTADGDDDAQDVKAIIQLPTESEIISFSASKGKTKLSCYQCDNVVICDDKGGFSKNQKIVIEVRAKKPRLNINKCSFGIYAYPRTPSDVVPENNHFGWSGRCDEL